MCVDLGIILFHPFIPAITPVPEKQDSGVSGLSQKTGLISIQITIVNAIYYVSIVII